MVFTVLLSLEAVIYRSLCQILPGVTPRLRRAIN
jgi:hypothetical protein